MHEDHSAPIVTRKDVVAEVNAATTAGVQRIARQYIPADRVTLAVLRDLAKIHTGLESLALGVIPVMDVSSIAK